VSYTSEERVEVQVATSNSVRAGARFDRFSVDLSSGTLLRSGGCVPIQGQPFQVLRLLLEAEGRVVTREELRRALWPEDTFVDFELGVNTAVKKLRQALEDSAEHPKFVETLPKFGYRFMIPVEWVTGNDGRSALPTVKPIAPPEPAPLVSPPPPVKRHWKLKVALALAALAVAVLVLSLSDRTRLGMRLRDNVLPNHQVSERRLTANPDDVPVTSSAISPDGKYLVFTDKTGFYLRQIDSGETHAVPLPKGFDALAESWFPDSIHLVVSRVEDPNKPLASLWEISIVGGTPRKLADEGEAAKVSPDGSRIAFLSGKFDQSEIWLMQADGGQAKRLLKADGGDFNPVAWSPDGRSLAYVRTTYFAHSLETKIEIADVASGQTEVVLSKPGLGPALSWTQAGRLIYSLQEPLPNRNEFNLWSVQLDSRTARTLDSGIRVTSDRGLAAGLSVSKDGTLLAVRRWALQNDVYVAELQPGGKRIGTFRRLTLDERQDYPYSWTPDSKAVFFASDRDGRSHIFKQAIDQTQPELVVGGNDDLGVARLTPDGSALLYVVAPKEGDSSRNVRIMRVPLAGGPSQFVLQSPLMWNQQCARLPSTLCIYSRTVQNQGSFFSFDPLNGTGKLLATVEGGAFNWTLSPDGKYLATVKRGFQTDFGIVQTDPGIQILSIADGSKRTIPVPGWAGIRNVDWSADGKSLWTPAFHKKDGWRFTGLESFAFLNIDLNGRVTAMLEKGNVSFYWAIPSPDGHHLALAAATHSSNVWLLQNF
jgi:Tol biopolymer transport system component/DNA-binding winged helix-turn-helix (wHTH) protein